MYKCPPQNSGISGKLSRLVLGSLTIADEGEYKCRVDYSQAPTKIDSVRLSILGENPSLTFDSSDVYRVSVPPSPPVIYDDHDIPLSSLVGPFHLGSNISLKCISRGGHPLPILVWTRDQRTLNTSHEVMSHRPRLQSTVSVLRLHNLRR